MKYEKGEKIVKAVYDEGITDEFLAAIPECLEIDKFYEKIRSTPMLLERNKKLPLMEIQRQIMGLSSFFCPLKYMYQLYITFWNSIYSAYSTINVNDAKRALNAFYQTEKQNIEYDSAKLFNTQASYWALLGVPGLGKSSTVIRCLSLMPQTIVHEKLNNSLYFGKQILYLYVTCPSDCSIKTLAISILHAINRALDRNVVDIDSVYRLSNSALCHKAKALCITYHIGVIIIDEIQNTITVSQSGKQSKQLVKFLVELTTDCCSSVCFIGTLEAEEFFVQEEHLKRRTRGMRLLPFICDTAFVRFLSSIWPYLPIPAEFNNEIVKKIYSLTHGVSSYIIMLLQEAQQLCVLQGKRTMNADDIQTAAERLSITPPLYNPKLGTSISQLEKTDYCEGEFLQEPDEIFDIEFDFQSDDMSSKPHYGGRKKSMRHPNDLIELFEKQPDEFLSVLLSRNLVTEIEKKGGE